jgi:hypothetical protein
VSDGKIIGLPRSPEEGLQRVTVNVVINPLDRYVRSSSSDAELYVRQHTEEADRQLLDDICESLGEQPYGTLLCVHLPQSMHDVSSSFYGDVGSFHLTRRVHVVPWPGYCTTDHPDGGNTLYASPWPCQSCGRRTASDADASCALCMSEVPRYRLAPRSALERRLPGAPLRTARIHVNGGDAASWAL